MTEFNNEDEAEGVEHNSGPIGVHIDACVIVDTDDHIMANEIADGVVNHLHKAIHELEESVDDEKAIVNIDRTSDYFYPETEE